MLPLQAAEGLLRAYGVSVSAGRAVTSEDAAVAAADEELGYPVALKANGIVRRGRSERAGVALDLHDAAEVRRAWQGITEELGAAAMVEAVVQAMAPPGAELRVAVEPHPLLGPVLTFGLGGVLADAIGDRVPRLVPFGAGDAAAVIAASRAGRALDGDPRVTDAVIDLLERVGWLADDHPELDPLVINPALGSAEGAWVVDVTAHVRPAPHPIGSRAPARLTSAACPALPARPSSSRPASSSSCVRSWPAACEALVAAADGVAPRTAHGGACCGQPAWNAGFAAAARRVAGATLRALRRTNGPIVVPSGSCATMMQRHWPELFAGTSHEAEARAVAERVVELATYLDARVAARRRRRRPRRRP